MTSSLMTVSIEQSMDNEHEQFEILLGGNTMAFRFIVENVFDDDIIIVIIIKVSSDCVKL